MESKQQHYQLLYFRKSQTRGWSWIFASVLVSAFFLNQQDAVSQIILPTHVPALARTPIDAYTDTKASGHAFNSQSAPSRALSGLTTTTAKLSVEKEVATSPNTNATTPQTRKDDSEDDRELDEKQQNTESVEEGIEPIRSEDSTTTTSFAPLASKYVVEKPTLAYQNPSLVRGEEVADMETRKSKEAQTSTFSTTKATTTKTEKKNKKVTRTPTDTTTKKTEAGITKTGSWEPNPLNSHVALKRDRQSPGTQKITFSTSFSPTETLKRVQIIEKPTLKPDVAYTIVTGFENETQDQQDISEGIKIVGACLKRRIAVFFSRHEGWWSRVKVLSVYASRWLTSYSGFMGASTQRWINQHYRKLDAVLSFSMFGNATHPPTPLGTILLGALSITLALLILKLFSISCKIAIFPIRWVFSNRREALHLNIRQLSEAVHDLERLVQKEVKRSTAVQESILRNLEATKVPQPNEQAEEPKQGGPYPPNHGMVSFIPPPLYGSGPLDPEATRVPPYAYGPADKENNTPITAEEKTAHQLHFLITQGHHLLSGNAELKHAMGGLQHMFHFLATMVARLTGALEESLFEGSAADGAETESSSLLIDQSPIPNRADQSKSPSSGTASSLRDRKKLKGRSQRGPSELNQSSYVPLRRPPTLFNNVENYNHQEIGLTAKISAGAYGYQELSGPASQASHINATNNQASWQAEPLSHQESNTQGMDHPASEKNTNSVSPFRNIKRQPRGHAKTQKTSILHSQKNSEEHQLLGLQPTPPPSSSIPQEPASLPQSSPPLVLHGTVKALNAVRDPSTPAGLACDAGQHLPTTSHESVATASFGADGQHQGSAFFQASNAVQQAASKAEAHHERPQSETEEPTFPTLRVQQATRIPDGFWDKKDPEGGVIPSTTTPDIAETKPSFPVSSNDIVGHLSPAEDDRIATLGPESDAMPLFSHVQRDEPAGSAQSMLYTHNCVQETELVTPAGNPLHVNVVSHFEAKTTSVDFLASSDSAQHILLPSSEALHVSETSERDDPHLNMRRVPPASAGGLALLHDGSVSTNASLDKLHRSADAANSTNFLEDPIAGQQCQVEGYPAVSDPPRDVVSAPSYQSTSTNKTRVTRTVPQQPSIDENLTHNAAAALQDQQALPLNSCHSRHEANAPTPAMLEGNPVAPPLVPPDLFYNHHEAYGAPAVTANPPQNTQASPALGSLHRQQAEPPRRASQWTQPSSTITQETRYQHAGSVPKASSVISLNGPQQHSSISQITPPECCSTQSFYAPSSGAEYLATRACAPEMGVPTDSQGVFQSETGGYAGHQYVADAAHPPSASPTHPHVPPSAVVVPGPSMPLPTVPSGETAVAPSFGINPTPPSHGTLSTGSADPPPCGVLQTDAPHLRGWAANAKSTRRIQALGVRRPAPQPLRGISDPFADA